MVSKCVLCLHHFPINSNKKSCDLIDNNGIHSSPNQICIKKKQISFTKKNVSLMTTWSLSCHNTSHEKILSSLEIQLNMQPKHINISNPSE